MRKISSAPFGVSHIIAVVLAVVFALVWTTAAHAQQGQYRVLVAPSGPAEGTGCSNIESNDGVLNEGDMVTFPGNFSVASGASVVLDDADGTQGTLIDGLNAEIRGGAGGGSSIEIAVTADPVNVVGGDGELSDEVCNSIVATTGISAGPTDPGEDPGESSSGRGGVIARVLPNTGGPLLIGYLGALAVAGAGLLLLRHRALRG